MGALGTVTRGPARPRPAQRTLALFEPLPPEAPGRARPSPLLSPPLWDLGHIARLRGAVAGAPRRRAAPPLHPELDDVYDAFETPRAAPRRRADACDEAAAHGYLRAVRERSLERARGAPTSATRPTRSRAAASCSRWWPSTRRSTPRPCSRPCRCSRRGPTGPPARARAARRGAAPTGGWVRDPRRDLRDGRGRRRASPTTASAPATPGRWRGFLIARDPVTAGDAPGLHRRRRLRAARALDRRGLGLARAPRAREAPLYWERDGEGGWLVRALRPASAPVDAGACRCAT